MHVLIEVSMRKILASIVLMMMAALSAQAELRRAEITVFGMD